MGRQPLSAYLGEITWIHVPIALASETTTLPIATRRVAFSRAITLGSFFGRCRQGRGRASPPRVGLLSVCPPGPHLLRARRHRNPRRHGAQPPRCQSDQIAHPRCSHQRHGGRTLPGGGHANRREPPPHGRLRERQARQSCGVGHGFAHGYCGDRSDRQRRHQPLSQTDYSPRPSKCEISPGHPAASDWIRGVTAASLCARRRLRLSSSAADHPVRARPSPGLQG